MQEFLTNLLGSTHGFFAYVTVFGVLVACGLGVPLPEDISLILGGFLAHKGAASLPVMMLIGFAGIPRNKIEPGAMILKMPGK